MAPRQPVYGQVVVGPPGSGKTTYCTGMQEYLRLLGRDAWVVNLDPANELPVSVTVDGRTEPRSDTRTEAKEDRNHRQNANGLPYDTILDVCEDVVNLTSVMRELRLGPNGGLVYCMEYIEKHIDHIADTLVRRIDEKMRSSARPSARPYLLFDLPGQVELYTHSETIQRLFARIVQSAHLRLVAVQLIDAHYCSEPSNFLSAALLATGTMIRLELPTVSVLSKVDLLASYGPLPFGIEYFTECQELDRLLPFLEGGTASAAAVSSSHGDYNNDELGHEHIDDYAEDPEFQTARMRRNNGRFTKRFQRLQQLFAEVVADFGILSFLVLDISKAESVGRVLAEIDKCNGYVFAASEQGSANHDLFQCAVRSDTNLSRYEALAEVQEHIDAAQLHSKHGA